MSDHIPAPGTVSIYTIMARLFATVAEEVTGRFGQAGEEAIRQAVRTFGEQRGQTIAASVEKAGQEKTAENYFAFYDMERSQLFTCETKFAPGQAEQNFSECVFARAWREMDMEKYGLLYCEEIDPAIARGYNPRFKCFHDKYLLKGDGCCHFLFTMENGAPRASKR